MSELGKLRQLLHDKINSVVSPAKMRDSQESQLDPSSEGLAHSRHTRNPELCKLLICFDLELT